MDFHTKGKVVPIKELPVPEILYKYRSLKNPHHKKTFFDGQIYIPSAKEFNDPFDSKIPFRYKEEDLTKEKIYQKCLELSMNLNTGLTIEEHNQHAYDMQRRDLLSDTHHLAQFDKVVFEKLCNNYGIYCLTPDPTNLLMWSYYGDSHNGFCIGYNTNYLVKCGLFGMGGQVLYRDDFPKLPLFLTDDDNPLLNTLFTKWDKWRHEDEYRLIHTYKTGKVHSLPDEAISEIVLGCQISDEEKFNYATTIRKRLPDVSLFQIELNKETFGLNKVTVFDKKLLLF